MLTGLRRKPMRSFLPFPILWRPRSAGARSAGPRVIDLSGAFRLQSETERAQFYPHSPDPGVPVTYGLTERYRGALGSAHLVANPGCYPTAAILAAAAARSPPGLIAGRRHRREVGCVGRRQDADRADALLRSARKHRRLRRLLTPSRGRDRAGARDGRHVRAAPRAARSRDPRNDLRAPGAGVDAAAIERALEAAYAESPFVRLTGSDLPEIKHVAHTNYCDIGWRVERPGGQLVMVVVHRQPGEGRGRPGDSELQRRVRIRRNAGAARL